MTGLATHDGPFVIACLDACDHGRAEIITDKPDTRLWYYSDEDRLLFESDFGALLTQVNGPTVDVQTVSAILLLGDAWDERTLIEEVSTFPPTTELERTDDSVHTERYWKRDFESTPHQGYISEPRDRYWQISQPIEVMGC